MKYTFTQGDYAHIKESGFNPQICKECQEIDVVLKNLSTGITSDLYEALKALKFQFAVAVVHPYSKDAKIYEQAEKALAWAES